MYRFKLEALLNHRRHQEEIHQKNLAEANKKLLYEQKKLRTKKKEQRRYVQKVQEKQKKGATVRDIVLYMNYLAKLTIVIAEQRHRVDTAGKQVEQMRVELLATVKKRKILERLKEREWLLYQQKIRNDERKLMDEIGSARHARKT